MVSFSSNIVRASAMSSMSQQDGEDAEYKICLPICLNVRRIPNTEFLQVMGTYCDYFPAADHDVVG
jgi:hypothetical protein